MRYWHLFDMLERRGRHRIGMQMPAHPGSMGQEHSRKLFQQLGLLYRQLCSKHHYGHCHTAAADESSSTAAYYKIPGITSGLHFLLGFSVSTIVTPIVGLTLRLSFKDLCDQLAQAHRCDSASPFGPDLYVFLWIDEQ